MPQFRRRPIVIEAVQLTQEAIEAHVFDRAPLPHGVTLLRCSCYPSLRRIFESRLVVTTIHGQQTDIVAGDWIMPEPDGEHFYPCKPDIFAATYVPATADDDHERLTPDEIRAVNQAAACLSGILRLTPEQHVDVASRLFALAGNPMPVEL